jgi:hypothetical protein
MAASVISPSLPGRMGASLAGAWRQARPAQRCAYAVGGTLILVGLAHLVAWLAVGGAWQGPVSLRKPTTFGISFGLTTITLAWITGQLQVTDRTGGCWQARWAVADTTEVAWVAVQRWRGVASHFNFATTLDTALFLAGAAAIIVTVTIIVAATTGYGALVAVSLGRTAAGLAPLDLGVAAAVVSLLGMVLVGTAFTAALLALRQPTPASA